MSSPFHLAGAWGRSNQPLPVTCPYDNSLVGTTWLAGEAEFERATKAAVAAAPVMRKLPAYERAAVLMRAHAELVARREEIGRTIAGEVGKALRDALAEADRGAQTFQAAAEEARRIGGDVIPMDLAPHGVGRVAFTRRYPIGPVAGIIVDETADIEHAVKRVVMGGFSLAGQSGISVQRVFVHAAVLDRFAALLVARLEALKLGNPLDPATDIGPMIEESEAARIESWVNEAVSDGATVLTGGRRIGPAMYAPTVLTGVPESAKVCAQEVFAPVVGLYPFTDFADALARLNRSSYGLQAGVFTNDLLRTLTAMDVLDVGGVMVNDVSAWRIDHMPYGGVKDSGIGREGPRYAIEEMTEQKIVVINRELT